MKYRNVDKDLIEKWLLSKIDTANSSAKAASNAWAEEIKKENLDMEKIESLSEDEKFHLGRLRAFREVLTMIDGFYKIND